MGWPCRRSARPTAGGLQTRPQRAVAFAGIVALHGPLEMRVGILTLMKIVASRLVTKTPAATFWTSIEILRKLVFFQHLQPIYAEGTYSYQAVDEKQGFLATVMVEVSQGLLVAGQVGT